MMTGPERPRFIGQEVRGSETARRAEARQKYIHGSVYNFVSTLPLGDTGEAPRAVDYTQPDATTCFYASLAGAATALHGRVIDLRSLSTRSRVQGLLGPIGAETRGPDAAEADAEFQKRQRAFVRREMHIDIRFLSTSQNAERIHALTRGLKEGRHVVFGLSDHWIALDGLRRFTNGQVVWTGLDPYPKARRLEDEAGQGRITPAVVVDLLNKSSKPVVVVEGAVRFIGRGVNKAATTHFWPA